MFFKCSLQRETEKICNPQTYFSYGIIIFIQDSACGNTGMPQFKMCWVHDLELSTERVSCI
jgi:hypothetical protein